MNDYTKDPRCKYAYLFSEGSGGTVQDTSGNGNTGTFLSVTEPGWNKLVPSYNLLGQAMNSVLFDNNNDYINAGTSDVVNSNTPVTICLWANQIAASATANGRFIDRGATTILFYADQGADGKAIAFSVAGTQNLVRITSNASAVFNTWQHWCMTWDGSTAAANVHIYLNNVETTYQTTTDAVLPTSAAGTALYIGNRADQTRCYNGYLSDIGIFNAVLTSQERTDIYQYGLRPILRTRKELSTIGTRIGTRQTYGDN